MSCIFCEIANKDEKNQIIFDFTQSANPALRTTDVVVFTPLNPVVKDGHYLVVPKKHVSDFGVDPLVTADVMYVASIVARSFFDQYNIITSCGSDATQTVFHQHVHIVKRTKDDGLTLPWTNQIKEVDV